MKKLLATSLYLFGFAFSNILQPSVVIADTGCTPIYGGGLSCPPQTQVLIEKKVRNPVDGNFVDNMGVSDRRFMSENAVIYRITVENASDITISNAVVTDTLPSFVQFTSGSGVYNKSNHTVTITIPTLAAREKRVYEINTEIVGVSQLQNLMGNKSIECGVVNTAEVVVSGQSDRDTAAICVEKQVLGVPELPKSGPEHTLLFGLTAAALFVFGRKLSNVTIA